MHTSQEPDALVARAKRLCETDAKIIAADPKSVTDLRAAWAEAVFLEAELVPMAFTEYDGVAPEIYGHEGAEHNTRWDKGFQGLHQRAKNLSWDTGEPGEADDNPMGWLVMVMSVRYRVGLILRHVNGVLSRRDGPGR